MLTVSPEHSWRWRESNPRPSVHHQGFSGRSLPCFSQPRRSCRPAADGLSRCQCPAQPRDRAERWILLADARHRAGGAPGLTAPNSRSGREGEGSALYIGTYCVAVTGFTRLCPQSSARFPWINYRSRSLSPPCSVVPGEPRGQRPQPSPRFTLSCQRQRANSDSRPGVSGLPGGGWPGEPVTRPLARSRPGGTGAGRAGRSGRGGRRRARTGPARPRRSHAGWPRRWCSAPSR